MQLLTEALLRANVDKVLTSQLLQKKQKTK